ncbi:MAG: ABC transporter permease [Clostridia bacterium]|nr:ABC transporter permease [Clostridia bacterium]
MKVFSAMVRRNSKLFFKEKGLFFTALITPLILLVLYATFLSNVYKNSFQQIFDAIGFQVDAKQLKGLVSGQLMSSLIAVSCVTVSFCANMLMVQDKVTGARKDMLLTPVKRSTMALSYYVATTLSTLIIVLIAFVACIIYVACMGWFLSFGDVMLILLDIFLLTMFGTALSSVINFFLSSQGQISAVGSIVSSCYGFICGAYMPISNMGNGIKNFVAFLPGTYGTALVRGHSLNRVIGKMVESGMPKEAVKEVSKLVDCSVEFFGKEVSVAGMYLILCLTIVGLIGIYVLMNYLSSKKARKS